MTYPKPIRKVFLVEILEEQEHFHPQHVPNADELSRIIMDRLPKGFGAYVREDTEGR